MLQTAGPWYDTEIEYRRERILKEFPRRSRARRRALSPRRRRRIASVRAFLLGRA